MRTDMLGWLKEAHEKHFAVPAFDFSGFWDAAAILEAAAQEKSPVILMGLTMMSDVTGMALTAGYGRGLADHASIPASLHLDHCYRANICRQAVDMGFDSVMIDASKYPLEENIARTNEVISYAHARGAYVEAEIGRILGNTLEGEYVGSDYLTETAEAVRLVAETGVDTLAVGFGTQHGVYKAPPKLNIERLDEIDRALGIPLVMHGGSGVPKEDTQEAIRHGISKVNVGTDIMQAFMNNLQDSLNAQGPNAVTFEAIHPAYEEIVETARRWIRACMANGRAK